MDQLWPRRSFSGIGSRRKNDQNCLIEAVRLPQSAKESSDQWAISTGRVMDCKIVRETPPSTHSRARLWP